MSVLITLLRILFSIIMLILWVVFVMRIFAPGTPETAFFFRWMQTNLMQPGLDSIVQFLIAPVSWVFGQISHYFPADIKPWIPISPAPALFHLICEFLLKIPGLTGTGFGQDLVQGKGLPMFPGIVDWRLPLSAMFWGWVEALIFKFYYGLSRAANRLHREQHRQALDTLIRQSYAEQQQALPDPIIDASKGQLFNQLTQGLQGLQSELQSLPGMGNVDPLTQLLNKKVFLQRLSQEIDNAKMAESCLAVIEADIDDLDILNHTHSHVGGDAFLREVGRIFSQISTPQGKAIACRLEGGKLAMMLTHTSPDVAQRTAELLRVQIQQTQLSDFLKVKATASFGVHIVCFTPSNGSFELTAVDLLSKADAQMYKAKRSGKNQVLISVLP